MVKKNFAPELRAGFYPLPFDRGGKRVLTLSENIVVTRAIEKALIDLLGSEWRWSDLHLSVIAQAKDVVTYEVVRNGYGAGTVTVEAKQAPNPF